MQIKYDLMFGCLGNGLTVFNRAVEINGDYQKIAHINNNRQVRYYAQELPKDIERQIESEACTCDGAISASQPERKIFAIPPAKFKIGDCVLYTNGNGVLIGERTITNVTKITYSDSGYGYYMTPTQTPWYAVVEEHLTLIEKAN
jgi:hypothetical protein